MLPTISIPVGVVLAASSGLARVCPRLWGAFWMRVSWITLTLANCASSSSATLMHPSEPGVEAGRLLYPGHADIGKRFSSAHHVTPLVHITGLRHTILPTDWLRVTGALHDCVVASCQTRMGRGLHRSRA